MSTFDFPPPTAAISQQSQHVSETKTVNACYQSYLPLRYGCNPHQTQAALYLHAGDVAPFTVLNGQPGYINVLDALNGWQLVKELKHALGLPAATSFKHVSPAGSAVATPLSPQLAHSYGVDGDHPALQSPLALAYTRARCSDPRASFGDFAAFSDPVDLPTATLLKTLVCDGVIAPGYEPKALELLCTKKQGKFLVLQAREDYTPPELEWRDVHGMLLVQTRNHIQMTAEMLGHVVTEHTELPAQAQQDLLLGAITLKYTQSNSVGYALDGQMIGIGAGQQSRIDCTRLAAQKAKLWWLLQHPQVVDLPFKDEVGRVGRINARMRFVEGDFSEVEKSHWNDYFPSAVQPFSKEAQDTWLSQLKGVSLVSDAFFPFRDNIDYAATCGVKYVLQPGGSVADEQVIAACNQHQMAMACSGIRLFHH